MDGVGVISIFFTNFFSSGRVYLLAKFTFSNSYHILEQNIKSTGKKMDRKQKLEDYDSQSESENSPSKGKRHSYCKD